MLYTVYLQNPLGWAELTSDGEAINSIQCIDEPSQPQVNPKDLPEVISIAIVQLKEYFEGKRLHFDFPITQKGTDFQQVVWQKLLDIPYGKTVSYLELSRRVGDEKAIRAVGTTNGKNKLWIVVPCHRVIGSDGSLTGYAGGIWRKQWLLEHERKHCGIPFVEQLKIF